MSAGDKYWYNMRTGEVEFGMLSPATDRVGPFDTAEEAANAPEKLRERTRAWEEDEQSEDPWATPADSDT